MLPQKLTKTVLVLLLLFLVTAAIIISKEFLLPVVFAILISMLLLKSTVKLQRIGFPKWLAILTCMLIVVIFFAGIVALIGWQISDLDEEISKFTNSIGKAEREAKQFIRETLGLSYKDANKLVSTATPTDKAPEIVTAVLAALMNISVNVILIFVYTFLFLFFRGHIKKFVLMLVPEQSKDKTQIIIKDSINVSYGYISGLAKMIACLWVLYGIGFSLVGIEHPIMFALICGTLEIVPFVGNLVGTSLALAMAYVQGGGATMMLSVIAVYAVVQFVQTYLLEPLVVGTEVNLNPLFTIVAIVLGEILWGIPGMIIAIPVLGIVKILCDNIEELKPYGFLLGQNKKSKKETINKIAVKIRKL